MSVTMLLKRQFLLLFDIYDLLCLLHNPSCHLAEFLYFVIFCRYVDIV